eukprot:Platyproteum_vivax@DN3331_c0_g1_i1.p1
MNEIVPHLYLGGVKDAQSIETLQSHDIRAVVTCCTYGEVPVSIYALPADNDQPFEFHRIDVEDQSCEPISDYFHEAAEFIHKHVSQGLSVLVHCRSGISRSASVVLAYLVCEQKFSLHNAFFHVRHKRSIISPNIGFMEQLVDFEDKVHEESTMCLFKYMDWYTQDLDDRPAIPNLSPP